MIQDENSKENTMNGGSTSPSVKTESTENNNTTPTPKQNGDTVHQNTEEPTATEAKRVSVMVFLDIVQRGDINPDH